MQAPAPARLIAGGLPTEQPSGWSRMLKSTLIDLSGYACGSSGLLAKFLRTRLGRVLRDIRRKKVVDERLKERFAGLLAVAMGGKLFGRQAPFRGFHSNL